jgi:hypothetical protein
MTSQINSNNIDGTYPVAGQDNDSQGFRDNFTATKTNFTYAAAEITDLQNKAVLKSALTGTTLNNNMGGALLVDAQLQDMSETKVALGTLNTGTSAPIDYTAGPYYTFATGGSNGTVSLAFTNFSPSGTTSRARVQANVTNTGHTLTLPSAVSIGTNNIQGIANNVITFGATGVYEFEFETSDGGTTISIFDLNRNLDPINLPSFEIITGNANCNLNLTTSIVNTTSSITANLAAGTAGQIKILAFGNAANGNCLVTVTNAAWGGSNIANVSIIGSAATFQYVNSKWFCVGNNGVTFS